MRLRPRLWTWLIGSIKLKSDLRLNLVQATPITVLVKSLITALNGHSTGYNSFATTLLDLTETQIIAY